MKRLLMLLLSVGCGPAPQAQTVEMPQTMSPLRALATPTSTPAVLESGTSPPSSELASLANQRITAAEEYARLARALYSSGRMPSATYLEANREVFFAQRDAGLRGAELVAAARAYRDAATGALQLVEDQFKVGVASAADVQLGKLRSAEASYWLAQAGAQ